MRKTPSNTCKHGHSDGRYKDGRCRTCARLFMVEYSARSHVKQRQQDRKRERIYGLSASAYTTLLAAQGHLCAACYRPFHGTGKDHMAPVIDHDHATGAVRGVIHNACNKALGFVDDSAVVARQLAAYLERH